jgi:4'-phosphopantetheinyl transferase EntD
VTNPARPSSLVARLFAPGVAAAELHEDGDASLLYPAEAACCAGFARRRIADFAAGRLCARRALAELGVLDFPITVNADRSPGWPPGVTGSISHTDGFRCAAAGPEVRFGSIGVDVEIVGRVSGEIEALVFTPPEAAFLATLTGRRRALAATIVFSAKEAFYKCQYALTRQWLDFHDVTVELALPDPAGPASEIAGWFRVAAAQGRSALDRRIGPKLDGRFWIDGDLAATGMSSR